MVETVMSNWQKDLLDALAEFERISPGEGMTTTEYANLQGIGRDAADQHLRDLWLKGQLETCQKMQMTRAGHMHSVPAYRKKA